MKLLFYTGLAVVSMAFQSHAQSISGKVYEQSSGKAEKTALPGAGVFWAGTTEGTTTDAEGHFSIALNRTTNQLVFSFVGYANDTLSIGDEKIIEVVLKAGSTLREVVVTGSGSNTLDHLSPLHTEIITTRTLEKAACCNLSESFETNASVSVSYGDAVTGSKQIQMLGLNGNYIQSNTENMPSIRGLGSTFGLNYTPGTWVQSIDIIKGAGSVVNGYESMTGQINVELKKPDGEEKLYLNMYANNFGRIEGNMNIARELNEKWSTGILTHVSTLQTRTDKNKDGFLDLPLYTQFNGMNRWKYKGTRTMAQFGVRALYEDRLGGQENFTKEMKGTFHAYGYGSKVKRYEAFSKIARLFPNQPYKGLGLIINASLHDQQSYFGLTNYNGRQNTLYGNLIYQSIINNTNHSFKTGASYLLDGYNEMYSDSAMKRTESVPGVFFEYTYNRLDRLVLVAGTRLDFHNLFGTRFTPRLHAKYSLGTHSTLRASAGKGFRVASPLAENYGNLVSSRQVVFRETIQPEVSWNYGLSFAQDFYIAAMKGTFIVDYFRTDFENQLVADLETTGYLYFYNLNGKAYANSFQAELNLNPIKRFDLKLAYRLFDVKQTLTNPGRVNLLTQRMMTSRDRVLFNAGYALPYDKWKFDFTVQWNGKKRMPDMTMESHEQHGATSMTHRTIAPSFFNINAQITRTFPKWDFYLGGENLNNFTQKDPIMNASAPFGSGFDGGMAWGPVTGRMIYLGIRYKIM